jgi:hypothetical protein
MKGRPPTSRFRTFQASQSTTLIAIGRTWRRAEEFFMLCTLVADLA